MTSKLWCSRVRQRRATEMRRIPFVLAPIILCFLAAVRPAVAGDAPAWMHGLVSVPLPAHDEKTDVVQLYSEKIVMVQSADKIKTTVREAYKILRPGGREFGTLVVSFNSHKKITGMRGWCIPAQGKDYEVKDKEAIEISLPKIDGSELVSDVKEKILRIPAADPGNIIGYEYEEEDQPFVLQDVWSFQETNPVREAHYSLQFPPGWEYKATWINYPEVKPRPSSRKTKCHRCAPSPGFWCSLLCRRAGAQTEGFRTGGRWGIGKLDWSMGAAKLHLKSNRKLPSLRLRRPLSWRRCKRWRSSFNRTSVTLRASWESVDGTPTLRQRSLPTVTEIVRTKP